MGKTNKKVNVIRKGMVFVKLSKNNVVKLRPTEIAKFLNRKSLKQAARRAIQQSKVNQGGSKPKPKPKKKKTKKKKSKKKNTKNKY